MDNFPGQNVTDTSLVIIIKYTEDVFIFESTRYADDFHFAPKVHRLEAKRSR